MIVEKLCLNDGLDWFPIIIGSTPWFFKSHYTRVLKNAIRHSVQKYYNPCTRHWSTCPTANLSIFLCKTFISQKYYMCIGMCWQNLLKSNKDPSSVNHLVEFGYISLCNGLGKFANNSHNTCMLSHWKHTPSLIFAGYH